MNPSEDRLVDLSTDDEEALMNSARLRTLAVVGAFAFALAACSNGEDTAGDGQSPEETGTAAEGTVQVADSDLGQIVVDAEGRTLYRFLPDEGSESTCYDDCEASWPPLTVQGEPVAGEGIDASLLGTTERTDGSVQVTLDGHPLYHFGGDQAAGDTNGQGIGDVWYVVSPSGDVIED